VVASVFAAGFSVAAALPPGPTVDVQVVPLTYGSARKLTVEVPAADSKDWQPNG
jgi:hypothetical protein